MEENVILVDDLDREIGVGEKLWAHREGRLHRAFSVFVFNPHGELLLQQRAKSKYHSGGLWTNTCCSHPRPGESTEGAVHRRLREEMGFDCPVVESFSFIYRVQFGNNLYEHEFDHVFVGTFSGEPTPCAEEVEAWQWVRIADLLRDMHAEPDRFTYWLRGSLERVVASLTA